MVVAVVFTYPCLCTFLSPELEKSGPESPRPHSCQQHRNASHESNRRNARVFTVKKKLCLRIIYYLHGGGKLCINVVELAQYDDNWHWNRTTHQRGMRDY